MIFMSKETNKKTDLKKLEKENLGNINGGYTIETYDDGTVEVSGTVKPNVPINEDLLVPVPNGSTGPRRAIKTFTSLTLARLWADKHLLRDPNPNRRQPAGQMPMPMPMPHNDE